MNRKSGRPKLTISLRPDCSEKQKQMGEETGRYKLPLPNSGQLSQEKGFKYSYEQQISHLNFNLNFKFKSKRTQIPF